jgi:hypothetical protein
VLLENKRPGLCFVHARMLRGVPDDLPRPTITPAEVARRLQDFLENPR